MKDHFPYMTGPDNPGHYKHAFKKAIEKFQQRSPEEIAAAAGVRFIEASREFIVPGFGTELSVTYPKGEVFFRYSRALPLIGWRLIAINYLGRAAGIPLKGHPITYRELEDGSIFYPAFYREGIQKLIQWLPGKQVEIIKQAAAALGAAATCGADLAFTFYAFPRFPVTLKIWLPDEELPASANITFDAAADAYLHTEDIAVIGWYPSAFIIRHYEMTLGSKTTGKISL